MTGVSNRRDYLGYHITHTNEEIAATLAAQLSASLRNSAASDSPGSERGPAVCLALPSCQLDAGPRRAPGSRACV